MPLSIRIQYCPVALGCGRAKTDYDLFAMPQGCDRRQVSTYVERMCDDGRLLVSGIPNRCFVPIADQTLVGRARIIGGLRDFRGRVVYEFVGILVSHKDVVEVHSMGAVRAFLASVEESWNSISRDLILTRFETDKRQSVVTAPCSMDVVTDSSNVGTLKSSGPSLDRRVCRLVSDMEAWKEATRMLASCDAYDIVRMKAVERVANVEVCRKLGLHVAGIVGACENEIIDLDLPARSQESSDRSPLGEACAVVGDASGRIKSSVSAEREIRVSSNVSETENPAADLGSELRRRQERNRRKKATSVRDVGEINAKEETEMRSSSDQQGCENTGCVVLQDGSKNLVSDAPAMCLAVGSAPERKSWLTSIYDWFINLLRRLS